MFKTGDKVSKANGGIFSNGDMIVTVKYLVTEYGKIRVWFQETDSWLPERDIVLVIPATPPTEADIKELI